MNATLIYTNNWDFKVYMSGLTDAATKKQTIGISVVDPEGNMSNMHMIKKSKIIESKNAFDFMFDFEGDFERSDIININEIAKKLINNHTIHYVNVSEQVTVNEAIRRLCKYVKENEIEDCVYVSHEKEERDGKEIQVDYYNIDINNKFPSIIEKLELGYKKLDLLKHFKVLEILKVNENRAYDYRRYDKNKNAYRVVCFKELAKEEC